MTIVSSLKKLFKKMTGKDTTGLTIDEILDQLGNEYTPGGGGSLPTPGAVGNVLTSTGSGWESAAPSDNDFVVTAELSVDGYGDFVLSNPTPSFANTLAAFEAGKNVRIECVSDALGATIVGYGNLCADAAITFISTSYNEGLGGNRLIVIDYFANDSMRLEAMPDIQNIPVPDAVYNGYALMVNGGQYGLVDTKIPMIVTATVDEDTRVISQASASLSDVVNAYRNGKTVEFKLSSTKIVDGVTYNMYRTLSNSEILDTGTSGAQAEFYETVLDLTDSGKPKIIRVLASADEQDGAWQYDETELSVESAGT